MAENRSEYLNSDNIYKLKIFKFTKLYDTDTATKKGPKSRSGHRIICKNTALFSIGGYNPNVVRENNTLFHEVWLFDFITKSWKQLESENLPYELASCATVLSGNLLFLYGGTGYPFGIKKNSHVYVSKLDVSASTLVFNPVMATSDVSPQDQYGQSIAVVGSYLYTVGGTDGFIYSMDVYRLNLKTKVWEKLSEISSNSGSPSARYRHEMVYYNDYLYIFGGGTSRTAYNLKKVPAFNLKTLKWTTFKTEGDNSRYVNQRKFPANRRCHGCVQDPYNDALVFINGGYNEESVHNDTWRLDLNTLQWKYMSSLNLPYGTYFHSTAATPDGRIVVFGGCTDNLVPNQRTSDVYSAWITVPKLVDACWDALTYYIEEKLIALPTNIKKLGLPLEYESRLCASYNLMCET